MSELFEHLDRIERREAPLPPIDGELSDDSSFVRSDSECYDDDCGGTLWERLTNSAGSVLVCGQCSAVYGAGRQASRTLLADREDEWQQFCEDRPRYRNSNTRRGVGGFDHEWVDSDDVDGPVRTLSPEAFYK